jgi:hypothetical protein
MKFSNRRIDAYLAVHEGLENRIDDIIRQSNLSRGSFNKVNYRTGTHLLVETREYDRCGGGYDYEEISIPLEWLHAEEEQIWFLAQAYKDEQNRARLAKEAERHQQELAAKKARDLEQLAKLKAQYEGEKP